MAAGFVDYLRFVLGWWSSPQVRGGFVCAHVGMSASARGVNGIVAYTGSSIGISTTAGAVQGERAC